jgi:hypothetical protein
VIPEGTASGTPIKGAPDPFEVQFTHLPFAAALTLKAADDSVVDGASTTLSGTLRQHVYLGPAFAARHADVAVDTVVGKHKPQLLGHATTDNDGAFSLHASPDASASYVAVFAGRAPHKNDPGADSALSPTLKLDVAQKVLAHAKDESLAKHQHLVVVGAVSPAAKGHQVTLDYVHGGKQHQIATSKLDSDGSFTFSTREPKSGKTYHLVVVSPATSSNSAGFSKTFTVTRA